MKKALCALCALAAAVIMLSTVCAAEDRVYVCSDSSSVFESIAASELDSYNLKYAFPCDMTSLIRQNTASELLHTQAIPLMQSGLAKYWYPLYYARAVIVINRAQTDASVTRWGELSGLDEKVCMIGDSSYCRDFFMSAAYAINDSEEFDLDSALEAFAPLYEKGLLIIPEKSEGVLSDPFEKANICIMFDYQAQSLAKRYKNLEIVIPEGRNIIYEKGILSKIPLNFDRSAVMKRLSSAGLYPVNGSMKSLVDIDGYQNESMRYTSKFSRIVLGQSHFTITDGRQKTAMWLVSLFVLTLWGFSVIMRTSHKGVKQAVALIISQFMLLILIEFMSLYGKGLATGSGNTADFLSRLCEYLYCIPLMLLPLLLIRLTLTVAAPKHMLVKNPPWYTAMMFCTLFLFGAVLTNDFHRLFLSYTLDESGKVVSSSHGPLAAAAFLFMAAMYLVFTAKLFIAQTRIRKKSLPLTLIPSLILFAYVCADLLHRIGLINIRLGEFIPAAGFLVCLLLEGCLAGGVVPSEKRLVELFENTGVGMTVKKPDGEMICRSESEYPDEENCVESTKEISGAIVTASEYAKDTVKLEKMLDRAKGKLAERRKFVSEYYDIDDALSAVGKERAELSDSMEHLCETAGEMLASPKKGSPALPLDHIFEKNRSVITEEKQMTFGKLAKMSEEILKATRMSGTVYTMFFPDANEKLSANAAVMMLGCLRDAASEVVKRSDSIVSVVASKMAERIRLSVSASFDKDSSSDAGLFPSSEMLSLADSLGAQIRLSRDGSRSSLVLIVPEEAGDVQC